MVMRTPRTEPQTYGKPRVLEVREETVRTPEAYIRDALEAVLREMRGVSRLVEDKSRRVDEYRPQTLAAETTSSVTGLPQFERMPELITSILIVGPATTAFTMQLGKRVWPLTTNASGFVLIAPVAILLDYDSPRQLTSATAGEWAFELMGEADARYATP